MYLKKLLRSVDYTEVINRSGADSAKINIKRLTSDSRRAVEASLFVCIPGSLSDGHDFALSAYEGILQQHAILV